MKTNKVSEIYGEGHRPVGPFSVRIRWAIFGFLAIVAFFLLSEHRAHFFGVLPWLFLLACPFLHLFMHGGHGSGRPPDTRPSRLPSSPASAGPNNRPTFRT